MSTSPLGTLLYPTVGAFSYPSPFECPILCWYGQEELGCLQSPSVHPWPNTHGGFAQWDAHLFVPDLFCS